VEFLFELLPREHSVLVGTIPEFYDKKITSVVDTVYSIELKVSVEILI